MNSDSVNDAAYESASQSLQGQAKASVASERCLLSSEPEVRLREATSSVSVAPDVGVRMTGRARDSALDDDKASAINLARTEAGPGGEPAQQGIGIGIGALAREIGLSKDTLRVWERRYGFPVPRRSTGGERLYSREQVDALRLVKRLLETGHRPSKILGQPVEVLHALTVACAAGRAALDATQKLLNMLRSGRLDALRVDLRRRLLCAGLERFIVEIAEPMALQVYDDWSSGALEGYQAQLFSEALHQILHGAICLLPESAVHQRQPRVLLASCVGERQRLRLSTAEAFFAVAGCDCVSLGAQAALSDVGGACRAQCFDIVALLLGAGADEIPAWAEPNGLRAMLPGLTEIWTIGRGTAPRHHPTDGAFHFSALAQVGGAVDAWRARVMSGTR